MWVHTSNKTSCVKNVYILAILVHILWNVYYEKFLEKCSNKSYMTSASKECVICHYC